MIALVVVSCCWILFALVSHWLRKRLEVMFPPDEFGEFNLFEARMKTLGLRNLLYVGERQHILNQACFEDPEQIKRGGAALIGGPGSGKTNWVLMLVISRARQAVLQQERQQS